MDDMVEKMDTTVLKVCKIFGEERKDIHIPISRNMIFELKLGYAKIVVSYLFWILLYSKIDWNWLEQQVNE